MGPSAPLPMVPFDGHDGSRTPTAYASAREALVIRSVKLNPGPARAAGLAIASMLLVAGGTAIAGTGTLPAIGQTSGGTAGGSPAPVVNVSAPFNPAGVSISLQPVATGLSLGSLVTNANDGSGRLFVVEQSGT